MYISVLFNMLSDNQSYVSSSAAQLLSIIMNDRGHLLHAEVIILKIIIIKKKDYCYFRQKF